MYYKHRWMHITHVCSKFVRYLHRGKRVMIYLYVHFIRFFFSATKKNGLGQCVRFISVFTIID